MFRLWKSVNLKSPVVKSFKECKKPQLQQEILYPQDCKAKADDYGKMCMHITM